MALYPYRVKYVTVILDVAPVQERRGPSRLLDMVPGRSKQVFKTWLASAPTRGASASRSLQWMDSPGLREQPPKNSPTQGQSWIPSTSCTWPVMLSMSVADAFSKNFATGAGVPRTPVQGPRNVTHQILPTYAWSAVPDDRPVFQRRARRTQDHLERLPEHHQRLLRTQHAYG